MINIKAAGAVALVLLTAACGGVSGSTNLATLATTSSSAAPESSAPPEPTPTPTPTPTVATATIGKTFTYTDGLEVKVSSAVRFTPSDTSAGAQPGQAGVLVTVSVTNGTGAAFDLTLVQVNFYAGAAGNQGTSVYDSAQDLGTGLSGSIPPGHTATAKYAFAAAPADLGNVVVQVKPDFNHNPASFEGSVR